MDNNKWDANDIPEQRGKVVIVTGSSSGIGFETARVGSDCLPNRRKPCGSTSDLYQDCERWRKARSNRSPS